MIINLYGHTINPINIIRIKTHNADHIVYFNGTVDATSAQDVNFIRISCDIVSSVDGIELLEPDELYIGKVINRLWKEAEREGQKSLVS